MDASTVSPARFEKLSSTKVRKILSIKLDSSRFYEWTGYQNKNGPVDITSETIFYLATHFPLQIRAM